MIVVQNKKLDILGSFTTLKAFFREFASEGANVNSYDHVRSKIYIAGHGVLVKYKEVYLTRTIPKAGSRMVKESDEIEFKL
jgi:hypothetical protein